MPSSPLAKDQIVIKVVAHLVDGGLWESDFSDEILQKAFRLKQDGLGDRAIIHELITDDWSAPPIYVELVPADARTGRTLRLNY